MKIYTLKEQIANTKILLDVIDNKIAKNEPEEVLNSWFQPCGTYGCVAGDTYLAMEIFPRGIDITIDEDGDIIEDDKYAEFAHWRDDFHNIFGFSNFMLEFASTLFSCSVGGWPPLQPRREYVQEQLSIMISKLA